MKELTSKEFFNMFENEEDLNEKVLISDKNVVAIPWEEYREILKITNPEKLEKLEKAFKENSDCNVFIEEN